MITANQSHPTNSVSRTELIWLAAAVAFGTILRLSFPGRMAIEHFDEGVYASNFWFEAEQGFAYPSRHLYAPPLLPALIEWTMIFASLSGNSPTGFIPMIPCLIAGIATIPSIWWIGRRWFGSTAGLTSAWLVSTSDFHACYSRSALTDVPVCSFILWAVYFIGKSLELAATSHESGRERQKSNPGKTRPSIPWREIFLAASFTGLAWWTKYNGWLPLAIGLAGGTLYQWVTPHSQRQLFRTVNCGIMIAIIAGMFWSPVVWMLQKQGGYAAVAANHRNYLVGFNGWGNSALNQLETVGLYDNWLGCLTQSFGAHDESNTRFPSTTLSENLRMPTKSPTRMDGEKMLAVRFVDVVIRWVTFMIPIALILISSGALIWKIFFAKDKQGRLAACLLAAWFCGMTVATPFYHPYPRLVFPWLISTWLAAGLAVQILRNRICARTAGTVEPNSNSWRPLRWERILVIAITFNSLLRSIQGTAHAWDDRTGLYVVSDIFLKTMEANLGGQSLAKDGAIVRVWGEPAMVFGLRARGMSLVVPVQSLDFVGGRPALPTFLIVDGRESDDRWTPSEREKLERCTLIAKESFRPSHLVEMDSLNRDHFYTKRNPGNETGNETLGLRLYRVHE